MPDVFISYSRRDSDYVQRLARELEARGKQAWIDIDGIRDAEVFPEALRRAIEGSDAFVFVISPDSVGSEFCEQEVTHASALNKRIVPLALRPVPDERIPEEIRFRNWIPVGEETGVERVLAAIETDLEWERQHTRITVRALQWEQAGRDRSVLLRGSELADAERWLAAGANKNPGPTALEQEFLLAARQAASRRQRTLTGAVSAMLAVAVGLLVFALISRENAVSAETTANAQRLAALSETQLPIDPERAVLLAIAAVRKDATYGPSGTMFALRAALDASTIRYELAPAGEQAGCGALYPQFDPSPGSDLLAEGLCNGEIRFLDARDGRLERVVTGSPTKPAILLSYPGRQAILVGALGDRLVALDPTTAAVIRRGPVIPQLGVMTPDMTAPLIAAYGRVPIGHRGPFVVWDYRTGRAIWIDPALPMAFLTGFSFAGPETLALTFQGDSGGPGLVVYDYVHRRVVATRPGAPGGLGDVQSTDGRMLAVTLTRADGTSTVELLNSRTLAPEPGFRPPTFSSALVGTAFSLDDRLLAYGFQDGSAGVLDTSTGTPVDTYAAATREVTGVAISPDDRLVITASADGTARAERIGGRALRTFPQVAPVQLSATAGGFAAIANPGSRPGEGVVVEHYADAGGAVGSPLVMSPQTQQLDASLSPDGTLATDAPAPPSAQSAPLPEWSVPGRRIVRTITLLNGPGGDPVISPGDDLLMEGTGQALGFNAPGPKPLVLIDLRTGRRRTLASPSPSCQWNAFAFSRTGAIGAAGTYCGQVGVWATATGRRLGAVLQIPGNVNSLAFSPDSRSLAIASSNGTVYVARVPITPARVVHAGTQPIQAVAYSPDGRYLATVGLDRTARVYDARTLTEMRVIQLPQPGQGVAFTTDSRGLLTWDATGTVTLWDACTDCENPGALVALARTRVTRSLTAAERSEFNVS